MTVVMIVSFGIISWYVYKWKMGSEASGNIWFNGDDISIKSIIVGMFSNVIFGMIDNGGLFIGASFLDEWFMMLPFAEDANVFAG